MPDPTLEFLKSFSDPSKWVVVSGAPVFVPHERTVPDKDGKPTDIKVNLDDLQYIADQINEREQMYGVPAVMTIGHRVQNDPKFREKDQPDIVGYGRHAQVGKFGPMQLPAVLATLYYKRSDWEEAKKYPFRSVDFYPNSKKVTGIALLKRDPFLPMGVVSYSTVKSSKPVKYGIGSALAKGALAAGKGMMSSGALKQAAMNAGVGAATGAAGNALATGLAGGKKEDVLKSAGQGALAGGALGAGGSMLRSGVQSGAAGFKAARTPQGPTPQPGFTAPLSGEIPGSPPGAQPQAPAVTQPKINPQLAFAHENAGHLEAMAKKGYDVRAHASKTLGDVQKAMLQPGHSPEDLAALAELARRLSTLKSLPKPGAAPVTAANVSNLRQYGANIGGRVAGAAAGTAAGMGLGMLGGPVAPVTMPVGGAVGGIIGEELGGKHLKFDNADGRPDRAPKGGITIEDHTFPEGHYIPPCYVKKMQGGPETFDNDDDDGGFFGKETLKGSGVHSYASGAQHAPAGGVTIGGKHFTGGQFITAEDIARGTPEEKARLTRRSGESEPRRARNLYGLLGRNRQPERPDIADPQLRKDISGFIADAPPEIQKELQEHLNTTLTGHVGDYISKATPEELHALSRKLTLSQPGAKSGMFGGQVRAPKGGIELEGHKFSEGAFIPPSMLNRAPPDVQKELKGTTWVGKHKGRLALAGLLAAVAASKMARGSSAGTRMIGGMTAAGRVPGHGPLAAAPESLGSATPVARLGGPPGFGHKPLPDWIGGAERQAAARGPLVPAKTPAPAPQSLVSPTGGGGPIAKPLPQAMLAPSLQLPAAAQRAAGTIGPGGAHLFDNDEETIAAYQFGLLDTNPTDSMKLKEHPVTYSVPGWMIRHLDPTGISDSVANMQRAQEGAGNLVGGVSKGIGNLGKKIGSIGSANNSEDGKMAGEREEREEGAGEGRDEPGQQGAPKNQEAEPRTEEQEDMPPEGHEGWLQHYEYASRHHPILYGMKCAYEQSMEEQAAKERSETDDGQDNEGDEGGARPSEDTQAGLPGAEVTDEGAEEGATTGEPGRAEMPKPGETPPNQMQENEMPVSYQIAFEHMNKRVAALEARDKAKDATITKLRKNEARKEAELLVYQLVNLGTKALSTPETIEAMTKRLANFTPNDRQAYFEEVKEYWEKDSSLAYAAQGAPVSGSLIGIHQDLSRSGPGEPRFTEAHLEKANAFLRAHPGADWEKAEAYAMGNTNGQVVTS